jgi:hypothetical protein
MDAADRRRDREPQCPVPAGRAPPRPLPQRVGGVRRCRFGWAFQVGAFDVETDPQRLRENVARRQRRIRRRRRTKVLLTALAAAGVAAGVVRIVDQDPGGDVAVRATDAPTARASRGARCRSPSRTRNLAGWRDSWTTSIPSSCWPRSAAGTSTSHLLRRRRSDSSTVSTG